MSPRLRSCLTFSLGCAAVLVLALIAGVIALRATFKTYRQSSASMEPTLSKGDRLVTRRHPGRIERGDLIVYETPGKRGGFVHRVIGLPGDVVELRDSAAIVNNTALDEPYIMRDPDVPAVRMTPPLTVPPDSYFVLGDNRDNANDSRFTGFVKREHIVAKVVFVVSETKGPWQP